MNPVPDSERRGTARGLVPVWVTWNTSVLYVGYGVYVYSLGLSVIQSMVAIVLGYLMTAILVSTIAVGSVRTGLPTLTQTRMVFGLRGNVVPAFFAYLSNIGWKVTLLGFAAVTVANSIGGTRSGEASGTLLASCFLAILALVLLSTVLGHAFIVRIEKHVSIATVVMTVVFVVFALGRVDLAPTGAGQTASAVEFVSGTVLAVSLAIGYLNYTGDFVRYLPRRSAAREVTGWTTIGIAVPGIVLMALGILLVASDAELGMRAAADPVGAVTALVPRWFGIAFSFIVVLQLVTASSAGLYSAGLALLALGVPVRRHHASMINTLAVCAGGFYFLFVSTSLQATFESFLTMLGVALGAMAGIQLVDLVRQRRMNWDVRLARGRSDGGADWRWTALASLFLAIFAGLGTVENADPVLALATGYLLPSGSAVLGASDLGVLLACFVGGGSYAFLTFVLRLDPSRRESEMGALTRH